MLRSIVDRITSRNRKPVTDPAEREKRLVALFLERLPDCDYEILRHHKAGKKHRQIAEIMGTDVDTVMASLIRTYVGLRFWLGPSPDGGEPIETVYAKAA